MSGRDGETLNTIAYSPRKMQRILQMNTRANREIYNSKRRKAAKRPFGRDQMSQLERRGFSSDILLQ